MTNKGHITYLDSIRGLAALTVINEHFVIAYGLPCKDALCQRILDYSPLHIWWDGGAAVSMFFVLSGFVLSLKYFRSGQSIDLNNLQLLPYIVGRLFRIWLPYIALVIGSCFLYRYTLDAPFIKTVLPSTDWINNLWRSHPLNCADVLRESFLLKLPPVVVLLPQAWTLSIELALSLLLPIGLLLVEKSLAWLVFFTLLVVFLLGVSPFLIHFLAGLMLARYATQIVAYLSQRPWVRRVVLLAGLLLYTSGDTLPKSLGETFIWLSSGLGASLIIMVALSSVRIQTALSNTLLRHMGKVSYSAYLIHIAVLICVTPTLLSGLAFLTVNTSVLWLGGWVLTVIMVQLIAWFLYYALEMPSIKLGRTLMSFRQELS